MRETLDNHIQAKLTDRQFGKLKNFMRKEGIKDKSKALREIIDRLDVLDHSRNGVKKRITFLEDKVKSLTEETERHLENQLFPLRSEIAELTLLLEDRDRITQELLMEKDLAIVDGLGMTSYLIQNLVDRDLPSFLFWLEEKEAKICRAVGIEEGYALRKELKLIQTAVINNLLRVRYLDSTREKAQLIPLKEKWRELAQEAVDNVESKPQLLQLQTP